MNRLLSPAVTVTCYVIGTACVLYAAAYWYYTIPEDPGPVLLYTLYKHSLGFVLWLSGLVLVGIPPALWFYDAMRSNFEASGKDTVAPEEKRSLGRKVLW
ncbi:MAG: hypothetical protein M3248_04645 [Actinomycetota bacterium]|nr:hypothetical protein [Actinomycetota bacterium]